MLDGRDAAFKRVLWLIVRSEVEKKLNKRGSDEFHTCQNDAGRVSNWRGRPRLGVEKKDSAERSGMALI